jgi:hypothetical protein
LKHPGFPRPAASACCCIGMVTTVIATTPSNVRAATIAIIAIEIVVILSFSECFTLKIVEEFILLRVSTMSAL